VPVEALLVGAITLLGLVLRLPDLGQSLALDEPHTWLIATSPFDETFRELRDGYEVHPPLYFLLAWLSAQVGDPTVWIRIPSLALGVAAIPLTYLVGRDVISRPAGVVGAAVVALSPYAVYYSTEARPYSALLFLSLLSTLLLLRAVATDRLGWWAGYAIAACAVLYTHYFGIFAVCAQVGWALWAARHRRAVALAVVGIAAGYAAWIPSLLAQPHSTSNFAGFARLTLERLGAQIPALLPGNGAHGTSEVPGAPALAVFATALAIAAIVVARRTVLKPSKDLVLLMIMAAASPLGLLAFSAGGDNVWLAKYMAPTLPMIAVLLGALVTSLPTRAAATLAVTFLGVLAVGVGTGHRANSERTAFKGAAAFIEREASPRDVILEVGTVPSRPGREPVGPVSLNFGSDRRTIHGSHTQAAQVFSTARSDVFVTGIDYKGYLQLPRPPQGSGLCAVDVERFPGLVAVYDYRWTGRPGEPGAARLRAAKGRGKIEMPAGAPIPVRAGALRGHVDSMGRAEAAAWALDRSGRPAGCIMAFDGQRLVGVAAPSVLRPDLARIYGQAARPAGFQVRSPTGREQALKQIRLVAVADAVAVELAKPGS
jgi:hypothetical protein